MITFPETEGEFVGITVEVTSTRVSSKKTFTPGEVGVLAQFVVVIV